MKVKNFCSKLFLGPVMTTAAGLLLTFGFILVSSIVCQQTEVEAKAKAKVITVKKIDQKTAKKVHQQLLKGKAFTIRFKGGEKSFYKKFQKLTKKVAKQTDVGFNAFPICMESSLYFGVSGGRNPKKSGRYTAFKVTKFDCQEYTYGIKFAKREYKDFKAYIKKILAESESNDAGLQNGTIEPLPGAQKDKAALLSDTKETIASLKELDQYLGKTKFRDLSGAMKARIVLPIGVNAKPWGKCAMRYNYDEHRPSESFKALYRRTAYAGGQSRHYAWVLCKISAVFSIGEYDTVEGKVSKTVEDVFRIRTKTLGGKTRYMILCGGVFEPYNDYVGFKIHSEETPYRRLNVHDMKPIKKINMKTQQLKMIEPQGWLNEAYYATTGEKVMMYYFNLSRSEW